MDWRRQVQAHLQDAQLQAKWLSDHLASDQQATREAPNLNGPSNPLDVLARIEARVRNARELVEANGPWPAPTEAR